MIQLKELSSVRLNKKLAGYTLLGAAAFTVTGKAHANDITFVSVGQSFDANGSNTYNLTLSGSGSPDFTITSTNEGDFVQTAASVNNGAQFITDSNGASALGFGAAIDPLGSGWGSGGKMSTDVLSEDLFGNWPSDGSNAYLGFYYVGTDGDHAGWINVSTTTTGSDAAFIVNNYAYDHTAGEAITAGQTVGTAMTPEPSSLSLLAMGSAGLMEVRRRRQNHA
jgi:PEP-CTERM motif